MTALWFAHLNAADRVSVKPHASPVLHAINYLLGDLDRAYLTPLREFGGLQSYPSRTKDPDRVDFSTGSVGLGAAAPLFAAATRRYVDAHFGAAARVAVRRADRRRRARRGQRLGGRRRPGDRGLGDVIWVVDFNRQSLDRVIPGIRIEQWTAQFAAAGLARGRGEVRASAAGGLRAARRRARCAPGSTTMPNEQYQSLFGLPGRRPARALPRRAPADVGGCSPDVATTTSRRSCTDLGGHDIAALLEAFAECDAVDRPAQRGLRLHRQGLGPADRGQPAQPLGAADRRAGRRLARPSGCTRETRVGPVRPGHAGGRLRGRPRREHLRRARRAPAPAGAGARRRRVRVRPAARPRRRSAASLVDLSRDDAVAPYLVTTAPDVATSTNLGGFINRVGVFAPGERRAWNEDPVLTWAEGPTGQHIELGISEMNLFMMLGAARTVRGAVTTSRCCPSARSTTRSCCAASTPSSYGATPGARFVVAGTPSGVTLAPEGGAHQSTITASVGPRAAGRDPASSRPTPGAGLAAVRRAGPLAGPAPRRPPRPAQRPRPALLLPPRPRGRSTRRPSTPRARGSATPCFAARCWPAPTGWSTRSRPIAELLADDGLPVPVVHLVGGRSRPAARCWPRRASSPTRVSRPTWST